MREARFILEFLPLSPDGGTVVGLPGGGHDILLRVSELCLFYLSLLSCSVWLPPFSEKLNSLLLCTNGGKKGSEKPQEWAALGGQVQYLHKALLPQLNSVGGLQELGGEVEAQLEGEALHVDALHCFLREMERDGGGGGWG